MGRQRSYDAAGVRLLQHVPRSRRTAAANPSTAVNVFEDKLGAQPPLRFYDPFGILNSNVSKERFDRLRWIEITHGRICQLTFLGQITIRGGVHLPGNICYSSDSFNSFPNGVAALTGPYFIPTAGVVQLVAFIVLLECTFVHNVEGTGNTFDGNFRNGYIDFGLGQL